MFVYEKKLQYPVRIANPNPKLAAFIISQYGGPDGELGASLRYLSQRYSMPYPELKALLTDIGREASEMFHSEATAFFDAFAIKVAILGTRYHTVKLFTLLCIRARNALIGKNLIKLPIGIALNILSEIPLLAFKRIGLVFIVR